MPFSACYSHCHTQVSLYLPNWPNSSVSSTRELWTGIANCVPPRPPPPPHPVPRPSASPTSQHRTVRCGLVGEWGTLLSTAAHSYIHTADCRHDGPTVFYSPLLKHRARWLAASARHWLTWGSLLWHGWMKYAENIGQSVKMCL